MSKGYAINIGINRVDPAHYHGWEGVLKACEADAEDMRALTEGLGFDGEMLLTKDATADAVIGAISGAAERLEPGDLLVLSYSGHGGQVRDVDGEEDDDLDETWVLYDRQLVDDELFDLYGRFAEGVRIFVLSDSCHSGSVTRDIYLDELLDQAVDRGFVAAKPAVRSVPPELRRDIYDDNKELYDGVQAGKSGDDADVKATVILISGCQDNQQSLDGERNGLFTETMLKTWKDGTFTGSYRRFRRRILNQMPPYQSPNYLVVGAPNRAFTLQRPFEI